MNIIFGVISAMVASTIVTFIFRRYLEPKPIVYIIVPNVESSKSADLIHTIERIRSKLGKDYHVIVSSKCMNLDCSDPRKIIRVEISKES